MKRITAFLLALVLLLACSPAMALEQKYQSTVFGTSVILPDYLEVMAEFPSKEGDGAYIYFYMPETDAQIISTMTYVPEFLGMQTKDLPKEEIEGWKEFFSATYPKRSKSVMLRPSYNSSQRIYRYYGQSAEGKWMLSYTGVKDGLYVSVCCETGQFGYRRNVMRAIFEAFNASFQLFAASRGVDFVPYDPNDYEVEIFNLLYDDSPDSIFRSM